MVSVGPQGANRMVDTSNMDPGESAMIRVSDIDNHHERAAVK